MNNIKVSEIATFLDVEFYGDDIEISKVTSLDKIKDMTLVFSKNNIIENINVRALVLVSDEFDYNEKSTYSIIKVKNPRLSFAKVVNQFFIKKNIERIHPSSNIGENCKIDNTISIGANCTIGDNVSIGKNSVINNNVVIYDNTTIGDNCYIKSGAVIGEDGFGFDFEEDGTPIRIPHIGNVTMGNDVEVGSNSVIVRGTLNNTIIEDNVKIDDQVFIAHNCRIGQNTVVIAFAEISGSVVIGKNCWIGPNCSIIQKVKIGDNSTIGIGSVITNDIESNKKIMGLESLELRPLLKLKKRIEYGK